MIPWSHIDAVLLCVIQWRVAPGLDDAGEWQTNTYMMGQSDFCICDLAAAPDGYRIRDFVSRTERTVILDLGGEQFAGEGP